MRSDFFKDFHWELFLLPFFLRHGTNLKKTQKTLKHLLSSNLRSKARFFSNKYVGIPPPPLWRRAGFGLMKNFDFLILNFFYIIFYIFIFLYFFSEIPCIVVLFSSILSHPYLYF